MNSSSRRIPKPPKNIIDEIIQMLIELVNAIGQLFLKKPIVYYAALMIFTTSSLVVLKNGFGFTVPVSIIIVSILVGFCVWFRYRIDGMI